MLVLSACSHTSAPPAEPEQGAEPESETEALEAAESEGADLEAAALEVPEPWPAPVLDYSLDRPTNMRALRVTSEHEAQVEVRSAQGPRAPGCDGGSLVTPVDGAVPVAPGASVSVCLKDEEGRVHARTDIAGWRSVPSVRFFRGRDGAARASVELEGLDDDMEALVFMAMPAVETSVPRTCLVDPVYAADEEGPEHCDYVCDGRVLGEVERAVFERVMASPAWHGASYAEPVHRPNSLGLRVAIEEPAEGEQVAACVRSSDGTLTTGGFATIQDQEDWYGCDWDTPSGLCTYGGQPMARGSVLRAFDAEGQAVAAAVRRVRVRRLPFRVLDVGGLTLGLAAREQVMNAEGVLVTASDLELGMLLRHGGEALPVQGVEDIRRRRVTQVDVENVSLFSRNGFAIRDMGPEEDGSGPPLVAMGFRVDPGPSDCSVEVIVPVRSAAPVSVAARDARGPVYARAPADCDDARVHIDADTMAVVASLGPETEMSVRLYGEGIECDSNYHVGLCGAAETPALWVQATPWCLPAGTQIETPAGPRAIETLQRGDNVRSFDGHETLARVLGLYVHEDQALLEIRLDDGTLLEMTPEHVVMAGPQRRPQVARDLAPGDTLYSRVQSGRSRGIAKVGEVLTPRRVVSVGPGRRARVYELRVSSPDTYFANGILVHNY